MRRRRKSCCVAAIHAAKRQFMQRSCKSCAAGANHAAERRLISSGAAGHIACRAAASNAPQAQIMRRNAAFSRPAQPDISREARAAHIAYAQAYISHASGRRFESAPRAYIALAERAYQARAACISSELCEHLSHAQHASRACEACIFFRREPLSELPAALFILQKAS